MVILDAVQNFKSVGQTVQILHTGPFFTKFLPKLHTFWTMGCRIDLYAALIYQYLTLVQISSLLVEGDL